MAELCLWPAEQHREAISAVERAKVCASGSGPEPQQMNSGFACAELDASATTT